MIPRRSFHVLGSLCILCGILLLLQTFNIISGIYKLWPAFPLVLAVGFLSIFFNRGKIDLGALGVGVYLLLFSILAFYYNLFSWNQIAATWPLFIGFLGVSFLAVFSQDRSHPIFLVIGIFLIFLCATFILVFSVDVRYWPVSLILFGVSLFLVRRYAL